MQEAAEKQGKAQARIVPAEYPDDCRKNEPHAPLIEGAEVRSILKRERAALDRQNARTDRCAEFYDSWARGLR
ncbi:hypothetical protein F9K99_03870 [Brucella anthropi]|nr:hypothetical protein [Brucella anthropi]KAB2784086.1 hypothetical protein F9K99_03870 [Brucella anthropi]